jgi:trans-aconitate methyltransferase
VAPDPAKVRFWTARASAYDRLCRRWEIFSHLSKRLIDWLPADLEGAVLDIGAGSGLTSELLLDRHPRCEAILLDPSEAMLNLARRHLAGRPAQFLPMGLDGAAVRELRVVAALASASMQFIDVAPAFGTLAGVVAPGGHVAFNLWWHHWEETAALKCMTRWQAIAQAACEAAGLPPPPPDATVPKVKTRGELMDAARQHGFDLVSEQRDEDLNRIDFGVDYQAMDPDWPVKGLAENDRQALLAKMHELADGQVETMVSTRFLFRRASH